MCVRSEVGGFVVVVVMREMSRERDLCASARQAGIHKRLARSLVAFRRDQEEIFARKAAQSEAAFVNPPRCGLVAPSCSLIRFYNYTARCVSTRNKEQRPTERVANNSAAPSSPPTPFGPDDISALGRIAFLC
jgi:hypothetical protein